MKTFYSAEDIENLADQGQREIRVDENVVLTDLAKQTANMLGIRIMEKSSVSTPASVSPTRPRIVAQTPATGSKPRGCQRRPGNKAASLSGATPGKSKPVVDKLVEKIKRINGQKG